MSYRVEFEVPGTDVWESAYGTYSTEAEARKAMAANKRELRAEGNSVGKWRVREGRGASPRIGLNGLAQWAVLGLIIYLVTK